MNNHVRLWFRWRRQRLLSAADKVFKDKNLRHLIYSFRNNDEEDANLCIQKKHIHSDICCLGKIEHHFVPHTRFTILARINEHQCMNFMVWCPLCKSNTLICKSCPHHIHLWQFREENFTHSSFDGLIWSWDFYDKCYIWRPSVLHIEHGRLTFLINAFTHEVHYRWECTDPEERHFMMLERDEQLEFYPAWENPTLLCIEV